jgi:hypothetical protein
MPVIAHGMRTTSLRILYDFPTSSEGKFPDIVDLEKKRQYTPFKIETRTDSKRRNLSWKQYTTPPEPISDD